MFSLDAKGRSLLVCGIVLLLFIISVTASYIHSPDVHEFQFHRSRYEQIIARSKAMKMDKEIGYLWMSSNLDLATLGSKRVNHADDEGMVEVYRDEDTGAYTVFITTLDRGHLGSFGYIYSDIPNRFPSFPKEWQSERQIDAHWWIAQNTSG